MGRLSVETRQRAVTLWEAGTKVKAIRLRFKEEGINVSLVARHSLIKKFKKFGKIADLKRRSQPKILNMEQYEFIDEAMLESDELTARALCRKLCQKFPTLRLSVETVRRARRELGWVSTTPKYCQLIREVNKEKRLIWCKDMLSKGEDLKNIIWTDECSVQLQSHSLRCYRKVGQPKRLKPKPKHPYKIHLWGGISYSGATPLVFFSGKLCATKLVKIFDVGLLPFPNVRYHRLMQDNDPKHTSGLAKEYLINNGINWWKTPLETAESPDLNPIENVLGCLKRFLRDHHKPYNQATLFDGIEKFWKTLTKDVCRRYINHVNKVIPKVIEENGGPSGY